MSRRKMDLGDPASNRADHTTTLRKKFELENRRVSDAGLYCEDTENRSQKQRVGSKATETEEIVRHMSNLPSYLERGKPIQDRALNFGVMDWGRLEKWQYQHHKRGLVGSNKYSPSCSYSSALFSTDESSPRSSRGQSCASAQKSRCVTLKSRLNVSPKEVSTPNFGSSSRNPDKFQDFKDAPTNQRSAKNITNRSETKARGSKVDDLGAAETPPSVGMRSCETTSSSSKGKTKTKIQDGSENEPGDFQDWSHRSCNRDHLEKRKTVVLLPSDYPVNGQTDGTNGQTDGTNQTSFSEDIHNNVPRSFPQQTEAVDPRNSRNEVNYTRNPSSLSGEKKSSGPPKYLGSKSGNIATGKQRSISPLGRFSFSASSKPATPTSATKRAESPVSRNSTKDTSNRARSSPLRRLLDPLFSSKATNSCQVSETPPEDSKIKAKVKFDDNSRTKQALFQTAVKNGRPLFTFAVDNNSDILAATVQSLSSSEKGDSDTWIYTFFTVHEVKKKNSGWLSHGNKGKGPGYVPNIAAQMKVSNPSTREFVLFSVDPSQLDPHIMNSQPQDELAAIVVEFSKEEDKCESFSTTVVLPGGHHGVPSKGEPSRLLERWRSGGACDCGGWDIGCRLTTLTDQLQSTTTSNVFKLFFQGEVVSERPFFSLSPLKEEILSVEYNSSLSLLQAFSICISVVECRKSYRRMTYVAKQVQDETPVTYAQFPPLSPVARA